MSHFSPGPWHWEMGCYLQSVDGQQILCYGDEGQPSADDKRLIAAAPQLLALLKASLSDHQYDPHCAWNNCGPCNGCLSMELIAEIEGHKP